MNATQFLALDVKARANFINSQPLVCAATDELSKAKEISNVINTFVDDYFALVIAQDSKRSEGSILVQKNLLAKYEEIIKQFKPIAIAELKKSQPDAGKLVKSGKNVYELSGAVKLSFANKATRNLSTTMGLLWERLAEVSPYAINPESEFGVKVKGIDLISKNFESNVIEYQQLKTQHNTLTGSQKQRSVEELMLHENPVFCASFSTNSSWTFNHPDIPRVSGDDFWKRIGISYESCILPVVKKLINELEDEYVNILASM